MMSGPAGWRELTVAQRALVTEVQDAADYGTTDRMLAILGASCAPAGDRYAVERFLTGRTPVITGDLTVAQRELLVCAWCGQPLADDGCPDVCACR